MFVLAWFVLACLLLGWGCCLLLGAAHLNIGCHCAHLLDEVVVPEAGVAVLHLGGQARLVEGLALEVVEVGLALAAEGDVSCRGARPGVELVIRGGACTVLGVGTRLHTLGSEVGEDLVALRHLWLLWSKMRGLILGWWLGVISIFLTL